MVGDLVRELSSRTSHVSVTDESNELRASDWTLHVDKHPTA